MPSIHEALVTGGTGYLGRAIVRPLAGQGHEPIVFSRHATSALDLAAARIDGDVRDHAVVRDAVRGVAAVIHAAALVSTWQREARDVDAVSEPGPEGDRHRAAAPDPGARRLGAGATEELAARARRVPRLTRAR